MEKGTNCTLKSLLRVLKAHELDVFLFFPRSTPKTSSMKISHLISGGITEVVQGLLQAQKAISLYGVELKTTGGSTRLADGRASAADFSTLDFDLAVTTRTSKDG